MLHAHVCLACVCTVYTCAYVRMHPVCYGVHVPPLLLFPPSPSSPSPPLPSPSPLPSLPPSPPLPPSPGGTPLLPVVPPQQAHCQQLTTALRGLVEGTAQSTGVHCSLVLSSPLCLHAFVRTSVLFEECVLLPLPSPSKGQRTLLVFP